MWLDLIFSMRDLCISFNLNPLTKFTRAAEVPSLNISSHGTSLKYDHKDHPNQHENSHKLCDEMRHLIVKLMENQWKVRQQHDQNSPLQGKPLQNKCLHHKKEINPKEQDYDNHSL